MQLEPKHFESLYPVTAREEELRQLVSYIREGNSLQLIGLPGVGRSSLLGLLSYNKEIRLKHFPKKHAIVHFVMVNFSEVRNRPLLDVMKLLFLNLSDSLRFRKDTAEEYEIVDRMFKEALSYQDELVITKGLLNAVEYLTLEKKLTLIFLFDRFDEYVPFLTSEFFTNVRSLRDKAKYRFSVVFSLSRPLEETLEPQLLSDFSDFVTGHSVYMRLYDKDTVAFRVSYLEKLTGKKVGSDQLEEIISLTGGHVRLTKLAVEAVLAEEATVVDLRQFVGEKKTIQSALLNIWQSLTPAEQFFLSHGKGEAEERVYLEKVGLLRGNELTIPLLSDFIAVQSGEEHQIIYDPQTNTIVRGETIISDSLTKAEFKLLRLLLQNQDRVVEREEIVNAVWEDSVSTAGVTEQALDQLIFRLRRKIEKDPNHPQHLQTIKGRGVKFSL